MLSSEYVTNLTKEQYAKNAKAKSRLYNLIDQEDYIHETYIKLLINPKEMEVPGAYVQRSIIQNIIRGNRNSGKMVPLVPQYLKESEIESKCQYQKYAALELATASLPAKQKQIVELYVTGLSLTEIATKLKSPYDTVKANMRFAQSNIRKHLAANNYHSVADLEQHDS